MAFGTLQAEPQKTLHIIILESMTLPDVQARTLSFKKHLHQFGLYRQHKVSIRVLNAETDRERGRLLLKGAISEQRPDLVVSVATLASQAAHDVIANSDIPQLFFFVSAPVKAGLVSHIDRATGTNITGITHGIDMGQATDFVKHLVFNLPTHKPLRIGVLHSDYPSSIGDFNKLKALEQYRADVQYVPLFIALRDLQTEMPLMIQEALSVIEKRRDEIDIVWLSDGPLPRKEAYVRALTEKSAVPIVFSPSQKSTEWGVWSTLFSGADQEGHRAALMANAILRGSPAGIIPVMKGVELSRSVNPSAAKKWGYQIPDIGQSIRRHNN